MENADKNASFKVDKENVVNDSKQVSATTAIAASEFKVMEPENESSAGVVSIPIEKTDKTTKEDGLDGDGEEQEGKEGNRGVGVTSGVALVGAAVAIVANEPTAEKSLNKDQVQKDAKKKAARWFGLRRSNNEKRIIEKGVDEAMEQDHQRPVIGPEGLDAEKDETTKADDLTEFDDTSEFKNEANASVGLAPTGDAKEVSLPDQEASIKDEANNKDEASAAVVMAATVRAAVGLAAAVAPLVEGNEPNCQRGGPGSTQEESISVVQSSTKQQ